MTLSDHVAAFFSLVAAGDVEIYNEFSLQHELGVYLRYRAGLKVQFERPVEFFQLKPLPYIKREIDISVFLPDRSRKLALELKFPRAGQYPEQMFKACQDIAFLEQLIAGGFTGGLFVMVVDDPLFFRGDAPTEIYRYFRLGQPLHGMVHKPTGAKDQSVSIQGTYTVTWKDAGGRFRFTNVAIGEDTEV